MRAVTDIKMTGPLPLIGSNDLTDGAASTLLLTEKRNSQGWAVGGWAGSEFDVGTSPAMNTGDKWGDMVYSGSYHPGGVNVVACDGSAHFVTAAMNRKLWYALITRDGGEPVADNGGTFILGNDKP
jgi:prepilin-type processing-associated H-X9-DG protein